MATVLPVGRKVVYDVQGDPNLYATNSNYLGAYPSVAIASDKLAAAIYTDAADGVWKVWVFNPTTGKEIRTDTFTDPRSSSSTPLGEPGLGAPYMIRVDNDNIFFMLNSNTNSSSDTLQPTLLLLVNTTQTTSVLTEAIRGILFSTVGIFEGHAYFALSGKGPLSTDTSFRYVRVNLTDLTHEVIEVPNLATNAGTNFYPFRDGFLVTVSGVLYRMVYPGNTLTAINIVNKSGIVSSSIRVSGARPNYTNSFQAEYVVSSSWVPVCMDYDPTTDTFATTKSTFRQEQDADIKDLYQLGSWGVSNFNSGEAKGDARLAYSIQSLEDTAYENSGLQAPYRWDIYVATPTDWGRVEVNYPNPFQPDLVNFNTYLDAMTCDIDAFGGRFVYCYIGSSGSYNPTSGVTTEHRALVIGWGIIGGPNLDGLLIDDLRYFD